jgi:phycocyanin-associated rod protein
MKVFAGTCNTTASNDRQVTIEVAGLSRYDFVRSSDCVMQVPYTRMIETLRLVHRIGGKITNVSVTGVSASGKAAPCTSPQGQVQELIRQGQGLPPASVLFYPFQPRASKEVRASSAAMLDVLA